MNQNYLFPESALILVAVMPSPKDMEIAKVLGWYRIPFRMAPKLIDVDFILFYQTGKFAQGHQSLIESYAEVKGHELTTRSELIRNEPEHPRAKEEYYKIQLGPLGNIPVPIKSDKWKRISFFYTLGNLVNKATIVNDLIVRSDERDILWKTIREKSLAGYAGKVTNVSPDSDREIFELLAQVISLNNELGIFLANSKAQEL